MAVVDLNADSHPDLAIGAPGEAIGTIGAAGAVTLLFGTPTGLGSAGAASWTQNSAGIPGGAEFGDRLGYTLGSLPAAGGAAPVLVMATPWERVGPTTMIGYVAVMPGGPSGPLPLQTFDWAPDLTAGAGTHPLWSWSLGT